MLTTVGDGWPSHVRKQPLGHFFLTVLVNKHRLDTTHNSWIEKELELRHSSIFGSVIVLGRDIAIKITKVPRAFQ
jgi:hypothetical protein